MSETDQTYWKKCSSCKKPIAFGQKYFVCSVSTCNGQRTGYVFCTLECFNVHLPGARHRDAGAIEEIAPKNLSSAETIQPTRKIITSSSASHSSSHPTSHSSTSVPKEVLIVVSKLKDYIRAKSEMNTSGDVADILSDIVRRACDDAIDHARVDGRKTVMARDFK